LRVTGNTALDRKETARIEPPIIASAIHATPDCKWVRKECFCGLFWAMKIFVCVYAGATEYDLARHTDWQWFHILVDDIRCVIG
jgi:hypothetical protein